MTAPVSPDAALSAEQLAVRAREGNRGSFDELVVRYRPRLVAFLLRRLDAADAEDAAQETFLRAYDHLDRYDPERPFATWLFAIGKHVATNHAVARARSLARQAAVATADGAGATAAEAGDDVWQRATQVLSPDAYRVLWLRYAQGLTVGEIAGELGRSSVAIKVMLFRARRRMLQEVR